MIKSIKNEAAITEVRHFLVSNCPNARGIKMCIALEYETFFFFFFFGARGASASTLLHPIDIKHANHLAAVSNYDPRSSAIDTLEAPR